MTGYAELETSTPFSFLRGASHATELVPAAKALGLSALGVTDWNTVAGVVRTHDAARQAGLRFLPGARLVFRDGTPDVLCYPRNRDGWGRLTRMLTEGKTRAPKGECWLDRADLERHAAGLVLIVVPPPVLDRDAEAALRSLAADHRRSCYVALTRRHRGDDGRRLRRLAALAASVRAPVVATNDVRYHLPDRRPLHDVLTCVRLGRTIDTAGRALEPNAERHLKSPDEMARLFEPWPSAVERTLEIVDRCPFSLEELSYEYPDEPVPEGLTPDEHLANLTWQGARTLYPNGIPDKVRDTIARELRILERLNYARYFLTVHDIVRFANSKDILCQGRGSSANSAVCYCLGITAVDPAQIDLLFERFVSAERQEPPDIDVDFEHEKREEVIQYIYGRYGRHRAGIAATVIHYRPKLAIREVGKVMGLAEDATAALSTQSWNPGEELWSDAHAAAAGLDPASPVVRRTIELARELIGFPRHLSQHVGGFVLTRGRLDETVPIGNAAMQDRTFIEWDKDDIDTLGIMKVDVLALGMLTCIHKAFGLLGGLRLTDIPREDPAVYRMLQRGDSLGVFQVESRAQMNMLPRLKPAKFYDLVIEVAIVRPGPIQGDMVHPYLRRRAGKEKPIYPKPSPAHGNANELERVLSKTLGVPLFQEQAMRIAIEAAKFTPEEANQLRRAMATFRHVGTIQTFQDKMVEGMVARGYDRTFAAACFEQIKGFGTYGFPESHAASFAWLVYVSAWLKCHHPAAFACALLNSQPMGFYAPAQIVRDARDHGALVHGVDVNASRWECTLEPDGALRLGLRVITGFREDWAEVMAARRGEGWRDFSALALCGVPQAALEGLADADALRSLGMDRRAALWAVRGLDEVQELPLFEDTPVAAASAALPAMTLPEHVIADYQVTGLSVKAHPLRFARPRFASEGVVSCAEVSRAPDGQRVEVAGVVTVRQRPGSAGGVVFATIEDETGIANVVVWPSLQDRYRREMLGASLLLVRGRVQRAEGVVHVVAEALSDRTAELRELSEEMLVRPVPRGDELPGPYNTARKNRPIKRPPMHPRQERIVPRSRGLPLIADRTERLRHALSRLEAGAFVDAARAAEPVYLADTADREAMLLLGLAVGGCGHSDLAADLLDEVARRSPAAAHPATDLMRLLARAGLPDAVERYFDQALTLASRDARLLTAAASWWLDRGDERAGPLLAEAEHLNPALPAAQLGLATVEAERGELDAAERRLRELIARGGGGPAAVGNLATLLGVRNRFDEAVRLFGHATHAMPGNIQLAVNHGMALLKAGRLTEGWPLFNRRLDLPGHTLLPADRLLPVPSHPTGRWLEGRAVLVTHDSGFGDTLQFARYLPMLADAGARVLLWVPDVLRRLLQTVRGVEQVVSDRDAWPAFDWHCPIIRLAEVFGTTLGTVPADMPYLHVDPRLAANWSARLPPPRVGVRRVGLVWAGSARANTPRLAAVDRRRSLDPALLQPLFAVPGVQWVSLQMGRPPPSTAADPMEGVADFADTAAIVSHLDAVVSVDTSVAHLAAAMNKPVFLLDRFDSCWRWLAGRVDSPWYPSLRIYRQSAWGDWNAPVCATAEALSAPFTSRSPAPSGRCSA